MKHIILTFVAFICFALPVNATEVNKDTANKYFESCKANEDPRFSKETQELFCACTAVKLMENYTIEDMQNSSRQDQIGRDATNKMITSVYAPCIRYPAREYHYNSCMENSKTRLLGNAEKICNCSADIVATTLERDAQTMLLEVIKRTPNIIDPMRAIYDDEEFQATIEKKALGCLTQ